ATITPAPPGNNAPIADAGGPYTELTGATVLFDGSKSSDPDNDTLTYQWQFGDGATGTGVAPTHAYSAEGSFTVTLLVADGRGGSHTATAVAAIKSRPVNRGPVAVPGGPYHAEVNVLVSFDGRQSSDPDGDTLTYAWLFGDDEQGMGGAAKHAYARPGTYTVTLT